MAQFLEAVDYQAKDAAESFVRSLHETGFGVLKNHPILEQQVRDIYSAWQAFFNSDRKSEFAYNVGTRMASSQAKISETAKGHSVKILKSTTTTTLGGSVRKSCVRNCRRITMPHHPLLQNC